MDKKKVLVVDDDENLRTVLIDKLSASGFEVTGASDGEEGLKAALDLHPDVILLDVMMPKLSGWNVLKEIRGDEVWGKNAKVVMLTVLEDLNNVALGAEHSISGYLVKTNWSLDEVVKQVKDIVG